jgi:hypothetical protein
MTSPTVTVRRTNLDTFTAADATLLTVDSLRRNGYAFWIVTPAARQRTTLEEYSASNARPVVNRIFFYVKNGAFCHNRFLFKECCLNAKIMPGDLKSQ